MLFAGFLALLWYNLIKNDQNIMIDLFYLFKVKINQNVLERTNNV